MKYLESIKYFDENGKLLDEKLVRIVDISEKDAKEMNTENMHGDGKLHYRKATKADVDKLKGKPVDINPENISDVELFQDKSVDEWTVRELKAVAEDANVELDST